MKFESDYDVKDTVFYLDPRVESSEYGERMPRDLYVNSGIATGIKTNGDNYTYMMKDGAEVCSTMVFPKEKTDRMLKLIEDLKQEGN